MTGVALHGGGAAKVSGDYEALWTLYSMLDLLAGTARAIHLEAPGAAGRGFEFSLRRANGDEWHQVKYLSSRGKWTLADLDQQRVLEWFKLKLLGDSTASCRFVSEHNAYPLSKLSAHAAKAHGLGALKDTYLPSDELKKAFADLRDKHWEIDEETLWAWLHSRVSTTTFDRTRLEEALDERLALYVTGAPADARQALIQAKDSTLYEELDPAGLDRQLTASGCPPREVRREQGSLRDLVRGASERLAHRLSESWIRDTFLARDAVTDILSCLTRDRSPETILITGHRGCGKSSVIGRVIERTLGSARHVLALDVGQLMHERSTDAVGASLDLPSAPGQALAAAADGGRGLLVIDALDSVGANREKPVELFLILDRVIRHAHAHPHLTVMISCRSEDLEVDERLRTLVHRDPSADVSKYRRSVRPR